MSDIRHHSPRAVARIRRDRRGRARRAAGQEVPADQGAERPDYALALAAAVANYELVLELQPDTTAAEPLAATARGLHRRRRLVAGELAADRRRPALEGDRERLRRRRGLASATRRFRRASTCGSRGRPSSDQGHTASCVGWTVADSCCTGTSSRRAGCSPTSRSPPATSGCRRRRPTSARSTRRRSWRRTARA